MIPTLGAIIRASTWLLTLRNQFETGNGNDSRYSNLERMCFY
jgi:hypothetical protein